MGRYSKVSSSTEWRLGENVVLRLMEYLTPTVRRKNIFACLFSVHNTISLSRHEQVCS